MGRKDIAAHKMLELAGQKCPGNGDNSVDDNRHVIDSSSDEHAGHCGNVKPSDARENIHRVSETLLVKTQSLKDDSLFLSIGFVSEPCAPAYKSRVPRARCCHYARTGWSRVSHADLSCAYDVNAFGLHVLHELKPEHDDFSGELWGHCALPAEVVRAFGHKLMRDDVPVRR